MVPCQSTSPVFSQISINLKKLFQTFDRIKIKKKILRCSPSTKKINLVVHFDCPMSPSWTGKITMKNPLPCMFFFIFNNPFSYFTNPSAKVYNTAWCWSNSIVRNSGKGFISSDLEIIYLKTDHLPVWIRIISSFNPTRRVLHWI